MKMSNSMLIGQKGVKYGLQVRQPKKPSQTPAKKPSIFEDDDSDEDQPNVEQQIARQASRKQTDKKVADIHAAALAEDASVFDYDAHYDAIQETRAEPKRQEKMGRQSRYIAGLLETAEERKREQDILYERQLAKERAAEDHLFGDKERFVTAAYRRKLEEDAKWKQEQKQLLEEEERNAVEKRGHMGDFYRNLFRSNVAFGHTQPSEKAEQSKQAPAADTGAAASVVAPTNEDHVMPERRAEAVAAQQAAVGRQHVQQAAEHEAAAASTRQPEGEDKPSAPRQMEQQGAAPPAPAAAAAQLRDKEAAIAAARERYLARKRKAAGGA